jgi:hypothetical protein
MNAKIELALPAKPSSFIVARSEELARQNQVETRSPTVS